MKALFSFVLISLFFLPETHFLLAKEFSPKDHVLFKDANKRTVLTKAERKKETLEKLKKINKNLEMMNQRIESQFQKRSALIEEANTKRELVSEKAPQNLGRSQDEMRKEIKNLSEDLKVMQQKAENLEVPQNPSLSEISLEADTLKIQEKAEEAREVTEISKAEAKRRAKEAKRLAKAAEKEAKRRAKEAEKLAKLAEKK